MERRIAEAQLWIAQRLPLEGLGPHAVMIEDAANGPAVCQLLKRQVPALQHQDIAERVAANIARRTGHPREDLHQIAMLGILQAARHYSPERGSFRPYAGT